MRARKKKAIGLPLESFLYLQDQMHFQRCGRHHTEKHIAWLTNNHKQFAVNGVKVIADHDLGGANGKPENSYEEHRWTSWTCEDMKKMLDEAGLPWMEADDVECIEVCLA